jgi:hypothetical protein
MLPVPDPHELYLAGEEGLTEEIRRAARGAGGDRSGRFADATVTPSRLRAFLAFRPSLDRRRVQQLTPAGVSTRVGRWVALASRC